MGEDLSFYLLKDNQMDCEIRYNPADTNSAKRGCLPLADYNPNIVKTPLPKVCQTITNEDPQHRENCGPAVNIKREEEVVTSTEETVTVGSSTTTTLEIAEEFSIT